MLYEMREAKKLPQEEQFRNELATWIREHSRSWPGVKAKALKAYIEGEHIDDICKVIGITRQTFWKWRRDVEKEGFKSLETKLRTGRPPRLSAEARDALIQALAQSPAASGYDKRKWNGALVKQFVQDRFNIQIQERQAQNWLHLLSAPPQETPTKKKQSVVKSKTKAAKKT
jgi:transposase